MRRLIKLLIIIFIFFVLVSYLYVSLFETSLVLRIPSPNGRLYEVSFNNLDIIRMTFNGVLKKLDIENGLNKSERVSIYVKEMNDIIVKYKDYYDFYYLEFQKLYPERYFILCISDSCDYLFFSTSGLLKVNGSEVNIKDPLILWIDEEYLRGFFRCMEGGCDLLYYLKEGIIKGNFKVKNAKKVVERILEKYKFTPPMG
ncbi:hypothetical protein BA065_02090 [Nanoarchaeota archaeon NZ13-N]|uniref:Uncharacterized protein n=1 Tax=Candidatus Nanoclepta minutus TaxID=1940235 RepID=A0A397WMN9_9ARCH|nr:MAG: hypothetical protein BA065_02090 [Nanoarchaeota archaeon NZ13-N]RIB35330.1 MAG: hypothetical protein BXU00_02265 [Candidatus Nanoclepta minutus]